MQKSINGATLRKMFLNGAKLLDLNKDYVDSLNVFPVPDGDTGTNMSLTLFSAAKEVTNCSSNDIGALCGAMSKGALRGARGNSGVILSQIIRGMADVLSLCSKTITMFYLLTRNAPFLFSAEFSVTFSTLATVRAVTLTHLIKSA